MQREMSRMNNRKQVIIIQTTVPTTLEAFFRGQLRWLQEHGFEVHAVSSPGDALSTVAQREGVTVHAIEMSRSISPLADLRSLFLLVRLYRQLRPGIVHGFTPKAGFLGMLASWIARVPIRAYTIFGIPPDRKKVINRIFYMIERISCTLAHVVFCESESIRGLVLENNVASQVKTSVLAAWSLNTVSAILDRSNSRVEDRRRLRKELCIPKDALVMGYVGRIVPDKGIQELLDSHRALINEFPGLYLLLVGEFEREHPLSPAILRYLKSAPRLLCVGFQRDVASYLAVMDVLVHPSYREGLPTAPLEASAMGLPVVSTDIPGCVDAVQHGKTGILVPPRDSATLTDAIRMLLLDPKLRGQMGEAGRQLVLQCGNAMKTWEALLDRYKLLLSKSTA
jgi:glycosyltransferase involved in cell wall biosynthesis